MNYQIFQYYITAPQFAIYILSIPIILISLTIHEVSHGYAAYKLGDPTAHNMGRLSLNPLKHLDIFGAICMLLFHFGWAKPVPINSRYFKKPKRDMAITALAGPMSNFILSFISLFIFMLISTLTRNLAMSDTAAKFWAYLILFFQYAHILNLSLGVFNFIPIPPLDGSRILYVFLPDKFYFGVMKYEAYISIALMILVALGAFSGVISTIVNTISQGMFKLLSFIPFLS